MSFIGVTVTRGSGKKRSVVTLPVRSDRLALVEAARMVQFMLDISKGAGRGSFRVSLWDGDGDEAARWSYSHSY